MSAYILIKELEAGNGTIATFYVEGESDFAPYPGLSWTDGLISGTIESVNYLSQSKTFQIRFPSLPAEREMSATAFICAVEQLIFQGWTLHGGLERLAEKLNRNESRFE